MELRCYSEDLILSNSNFDDSNFMSEMEGSWELVIISILEEDEGSLAGRQVSFHLHRSEVRC